MIISSLLAVPPRLCGHPRLIPVLRYLDWHCQNEEDIKSTTAMRSQGQVYSHLNITHEADRDG
jgi:hypothetical protein